MSELHHHRHDGSHLGVHAAPGGLAVSAGGFTLKAAPTTFEPGREVEFGVRILGPNGGAVTNLDEQHEAPMHLIVVRRNLTHYQHLHPSPNADGTWTTPLTLPEPGVYRAFADFAVRGAPLTLGVDLTAPGYYAPGPLPAPISVVRTKEGYEVELVVGAPAVGSETPLSFRVSHKGREVADFEPYLGALGHLVALREGDLAYLHVHPTDGAGSQIVFSAVFPSIGRYRLFLQFAHERQIHTAEFTVEVPPG